MIPLGVAVILPAGYHLLMLILGMIMRLFSRPEALQESASSDVVKVHV